MNGFEVVAIFGFIPAGVLLLIAAPLYLPRWWRRLRTTRGQGEHAAAPQSQDHEEAPAATGSADYETEPPSHDPVQSPPPGTQPLHSLEDSP